MMLVGQPLVCQAALGNSARRSRQGSMTKLVVSARTTPRLASKPAPHSTTGSQRRLVCRADLTSTQGTDSKDCVDDQATRLLEVYQRCRGARLESKEAHTQAQVDFLSGNSSDLFGPLSQAAAAAVGDAVKSVPDLGEETRAIVVGADGHAAEALTAIGVGDILEVDVVSSSEAKGQAAAAASVCGNDKCRRTWIGDISELPDYLGSADVIIFCGSLGRMHDMRLAILRSMLLLRPGGYILMCEPYGRGWQNQVAAVDPQHMPHAISDREGLESLLSDLSLDVVSVVDTESSYSALVQLPPDRWLSQAPIYIDGDVTTGFGRGSKQMGVPTANLPPGPLEDKIGCLPVGVYFGWAQLRAGAGSRAEVHKMVMNIGYRPTCEDDGGLTVELHVLHQFDEDFYGEPMRAVVLGYIRPEMKFQGLDKLIARIKADIGIARTTLDLPRFSEFIKDPFFDA